MHNHYHIYDIQEYTFSAMLNPNRFYYSRDPKRIVYYSLLSFILDSSVSSIPARASSSFSFDMTQPESLDTGVSGNVSVISSSIGNSFNASFKHFLNLKRWPCNFAGDMEVFMFSNIARTLSRSESVAE